jgi:hypothetical protein
MNLFMSIFNKRLLGLFLFLFIISFGLFVSVKIIEAGYVNLTPEFQCGSTGELCELILYSSKDLAGGNSYQEPGEFLNFELNATAGLADPTFKINNAPLVSNPPCEEAYGFATVCKRTNPNNTTNVWKAPSDPGCHVFPISANWVEPPNGNFCCGWPDGCIYH